MLKSSCIHICCDDIYVGPGEAALSRSFALRMWNARNVYGVCLLGSTGFGGVQRGLLSQESWLHKKSVQGREDAGESAGRVQVYQWRMAMLCPADDVLAAQHWWVRVPMATGQS